MKWQAIILILRITPKAWECRNREDNHLIRIIKILISEEPRLDSLWVNQWECRTVQQAVAITASVGPDGLFLTLPTFDTETEAHAAIAAIERAT